MKPLDAILLLGFGVCCGMTLAIIAVIIYSRWLKRDTKQQIADSIGVHLTDDEFDKVLERTAKGQSVPEAIAEACTEPEPEPERRPLTDEERRWLEREVNFPRSNDEPIISPASVDPSRPWESPEAMAAALKRGDTFLNPHEVLEIQRDQARPRQQIEDFRSARAWGELPFSELAPMFLDQFLIRFFHEIMILPPPLHPNDPWDAFVSCNGWARDLPLLFEKLTGYELTDYQKNQAIAEWFGRMRKEGKRSPITCTECLHHGPNGGDGHSNPDCRYASDPMQPRANVK